MRHMRMIVSLVSVLLIASVAGAQQHKPSIDFETILDTYFDAENGLVQFQGNVVAFAPDGAFHGEVAVLDAQGEIVARHAFRDSIRREGVFGVVQVEGPAEVTLTKPGIYTLVYLVAGEPVTRMPVRLNRLALSDDPYDPKVTYRFDGYWRTHGHITMTQYKDRPLPELTFWIGGQDLPQGAQRDLYFVRLIRDGTVVAHSKHSLGSIPEGRFVRTKSQLFHPHEAAKAANAEFFMKSDWMVDGTYELRVTRKSDDVMIRSFDFNVAGGEIVPLPQTALDYEPHVDHIMPRIQRKNVTVFEMIPAIWIRDGGNVVGKQ